MSPQIYPLGSNSLSVPLGVTAAAVVLVAVFWKHRRPERFPPGPPSIPLLGSRPWIPQKSKDSGREIDVVDVFQSLMEKYGDIFSVNFGSQWTVVICDYEGIKEACLYKGKEFGGRPLFPAEKYHRPFFPDIKGIVSGDYGDEWKKQRHLALTVLKELGYGKSIIEAKIHDEADKLAEVFKSYKGKPFDPTHHIHDSIINIIFALLINKNFDYSDPNFRVLRDAIDKAFDFFSKDKLFRGVHLYLPKYKRFIQSCKENYDIILNFIHDNIDLRKEALKKLEKPECFIDSYVQLVNKGDGSLRDWLIPHMEDFIFAGMETTATTLTWALYFMVKYPEIQLKVQKELDEVVVQGQHAGLEDREKLPYTEATLLEVLRMASTVPVALPHLTLCDTSVKGYNIPKGCEVYMFLKNVHFNPNIFPEPTEFRPERFLDADGCLMRREELIPFNTGRRTCLGEQLAKQELFLFFTAIMKLFSARLPEGSTLPNPRGPVIITHRVPSYKVKMEERG